MQRWMTATLTLTLALLGCGSDYQDSYRVGEDAPIESVTAAWNGGQPTVTITKPADARGVELVMEEPSVEEFITIGEGCEGPYFPKCDFAAEDWPLRWTDQSYTLQMECSRADADELEGAQGPMQLYAYGSFESGTEMSTRWHLTSEPIQGLPDSAYTPREGVRAEDRQAKPPCELILL